MAHWLELADIFRLAGSAYRSDHAGHLSLQQLKVMSAIEQCRTAALSGHVEACEDCGLWRRPSAGDEARNRRVHPPLPHQCSAACLPPHSALRPARRLRPQGQPHARSRTAQRRRAT
ncbi:hypothetical protein BMJ34_00905 [Sinorhizobium medicae]|uniref:Transposase zinc-binding domain-containing protein n=1 Tax=Sinorhizobium medicae TaxID=110321 RepID=A0ABX4TRW2_9HYPH|nr:hypothetical protein BMJ33_06485 [Sinorhizobium medicae]PLU08837.1 hypothetical protein BMJ34_00905 [Sinorhizobium medicae]PLU18346.1 hypothetical protein BMJ29_18740 [Sinorhizobium medicae]PLU24509.1 hypothetical protein BMJ30_00815 [Sinorhizobium medicae]PLU40303.1 hypothetical protein BMJ27_02015 [Sinorhizobium medicae]